MRDLESEDPAKPPQIPTHRGHNITNIVVLSQLVSSFIKLRNCLCRDSS